MLLSPAHQYPTGGVMSGERRLELAAWLRKRNAFALEDDYDAEFRYDRAPVGALQGLEPEHVVYVGTVSKTLAPGMRLGWIVAPVSLLADFHEHPAPRRQRPLAARAAHDGRVHPLAATSTGI